MPSSLCLGHVPSIDQRDKAQAQCTEVEFQGLVLEKRELFYMSEERTHVRIKCGHCDVSLYVSM